MQLLRKLAFPISLIYGLVVYLRNFLYNTGFFSSRTFRTPTVCIGNLSVGGTGKTPMVELLIELFGTSRRIAVLSRGYRRKSGGFIKADRGSTAEQIGDEPFLIHSKYPDITVAVDANRSRGIALLEAQDDPEIILLDDAFQHRKVRPDIGILLTAFGKLYTDDYYLPTGDLRDSRGEAKRADIIIVTKCREDISAADQQKIGGKLNPQPHQQLLFASFEYDKKLGGTGPAICLDDLSGKKITLVTGIASPESLQGFLASSGIACEHLKFSDHHYFSEKEIKDLERRQLVLTTEKDYLRMSHPSANIYYIKVKHKLLGNGLSLLKERLKEL